MSVAAILKGKGRDIIAETADATLAQICQILAEKRIGAVLITDASNNIAGIISERDIVRAIGRTGAEALESTVADVMTKAVITCEEGDTVDDVMEKMSSGRFRHVPVVSDGHPVGLVSIGDIVKFKIAKVEQEAEHMRSYIATT